MKTAKFTLSILSFATIVLLIAQPACPSDDAQRTKAELSRWVMNYYIQPDPDQFVSRVKIMAETGMLYDRSPGASPNANVMFLGKIMAANPGKIRGWMEALASLPAEEQQVLKKAVWYSGTAEGNAWLEEHGEAALAKGPRPMLLSNQQMPQLQPYHLDELWEWFFATGEEQPVARIVSLFSLAHEPPKIGSLDLLPPPSKPTASATPKSEEGPKKSGEVYKMDDESLYKLRMQNYSILKPAMWSCTSLAIQQDRVLDLLRQMEKKHYHAGIKAWLARIIEIAESERAKQQKK